MAHTASFKKVKAFSPSDLDDANNFTNISSHDKLVKYRDQGKARKVEDFNPIQGPIDIELLMISGGGRSHGSIAIGDGLIRCPSTLPEIKARQSSSGPSAGSTVRLNQEENAAISVQPICHGPHCLFQESQGILSV